MNSYSVSGIILAAGGSRRMGVPKAVMKYGDETFLEHICGMLRSAGVVDIRVVLGADSASVLSVWKADGETVLINTRPEDGQLSSLKVAVRDIIKKNDSASSILCLVDMPLVSAGTYKEIINCHGNNAGRIVIPRYRGKGGHPVVLDRIFFDDIMAAPPEEGLHWVMKRNSGKIVRIEVGDPGVITDIDTVEEYEDMARKAKA